MRRAYSYVRFSRKEQGQGDSLRRQLACTKAYCERRGLALDETLQLHDLGVSAFNGKNAAVGALAAFREAVQLARVPKGSVLIIESLDRLSRAAIDDAYELFRELLRAGIDITTLQPEREYTKASLQDFAGILEPLFIMSRAYEESAMKSHRIRSVWQAKRDRLAEQPATAKCPAWVRLKTDRSGYVLIPAAAKAVRHIYELARKGYGSARIARLLNEEGVPPITPKRERWGRGYVLRVLGMKAACGEFQPSVYQDGRRVPTGASVKNYYPAVISEKDWYATRQTVEQRFTQRGRAGRDVTNLFTGVIFDARDGRPMIIKRAADKANIAYLVSSGVVLGENNCRYISFQYATIERAILTLLESKLAMELVREAPNGREDELAALTGKLVDLDRRIRLIKQRLETDPDLPPLFDALRKLEDKKRATSAALERVKREQTSNHAETLGEARSLITMLEQCSQDKLADLRTRLKSRIRALVEGIWILIEGPRKGKWATVQLLARTGNWLQATFRQDLRGPYPIVSMGDKPLFSPEFDLSQLHRKKTTASFPRPDKGLFVVRGVATVGAAAIVVGTSSASATTASSSDEEAGSAQDWPGQDQPGGVASS